jgi:amino acid transporter
MKLNIHNNLASLYRYFYLTSELPNNLCSYFWKLLIAIVCTPLVLPSLLLNRYGSNTFVLKTYVDHNGNECSDYRKYNESVPTGVGLLLNVVITMVGGLMIALLTWIGLLDKDFGNNFPVIMQILTIFGFGLATIVTVILSVLGIGNAWNKIEDMNKPKTQEEWDRFWNKEEEKDKAKRLKLIEKEKNPGFFKILWARIKAAKEKNCPIIEWEDKK